MSQTNEDLFAAVLKGIGAPVTQANLQALAGVAHMEGLNDRFNPLNSVVPYGSSTSFNSVGVQDYKSFDNGVQGTIKLLEGSPWTGVVAALRAGNSAQNVAQQFANVYQSWDPGVTAQTFLGGGGSDLQAGAGTDGGSTQTSGGGAPNMTAADYESALGNLSGILNTVPELKDLLGQAVSAGWTADNFMQHMQQTNWWRTHSDDARRVIGLQSADPAQYQQELTQYVGHINQLAHTLGMNLTTGQTLDIAKRAMTGGLTGDQGWLQTQIAGVQNFLHTSNLDSLNGQEAQVANQLSQLAGEYGQSWGANQFAYRAQQILAGKTTIDTYQNLMKQQAKSMFPGLASQIDAGMTVKDLASPYVQAMSNILELDPSAIQLTDPLVKRALQGTQGVSDGKTTTPTAMPVWQFEQQLRSDPRWAQTQNAKDTISSALVKVGQDFGFGPNG